PGTKRPFSSPPDSRMTEAEKGGGPTLTSLSKNPRFVKRKEHTIVRGCQCLEIIGGVIPTLTISKQAFRITAPDRSGDNKHRGFSTSGKSIQQKPALFRPNQIEQRLDQCEGNSKH
ncbi:hypothetical protein VZ95_20465, partial [Elstera litoralis]